METIKIKTLGLKPQSKETHSYIYVEEVKLDTGSISVPNMDKQAKTMKFGKVKFTSIEDADLLGKIVLVDPWRATPAVFNMVTYLQLPESKLTLVEDKDE